MGADNESPVATQQDGGVGIIELARPDKFNCLSLEVCQGLGAALDRFEAPGSDVRALLVRAQGPHFCTGADLQQVKGLRHNAQELAGFMAAGHRVLRRLEASALPVVAACQGLSLAGGLELMLACDVVFAARDARFGDQHAQFGLIPGWGGSQRLPRLIGLRRALDLFYSARWLSADDARAIGLVNHVCAPERPSENSSANGPWQSAGAPQSASTRLSPRASRAKPVWRAIWGGRPWLVSRASKFLTRTDSNPVPPCNRLRPSSP